MQDLQKEIIKDYSIEIHSYKDNIIDNIPDFITKTDKITDINDGSIIQLLDSDYICGKAHLSQAISHAFRAFDDNENFANDPGLEICVRLSAQKQIKEALKLLGIKNKGNITVVYINTTPEQVDMMEELLTPRCDELLEEYDIEKIVDAYQLKSCDNIVDMLNEKIAMLAIKY
ncbi:MAG: KEOPS complex subunit Cgi121 [Methanosphaera sp.]|uniref:KEOPS complex subunit Cgi121 n=1 Tax=Methanosphaera sp. TaxID=2666342 RepID=UPI0025F99BD9|nr:KEOPS complex subunit Cgi121 [Methanosphaera sp.]MCI5867435.1 KEOPS complex subunit Cgi121 [Methanosphaera sp.]MDD6534497.1 KEOPS complex subunit Cgi121 [Methanosphaera sp.]MDY3955834.1 KEOPS complex subunit Cgi121 [Methanosphaera sp.]